MLIPAATTLDRLVTLTAPGAPVAPVVTALNDVRTALDAGRPALEQARASAWLIGEIDRIRGAASTLRDSLHELAQVDGMTHFDPAFAADDPGWDAWFTQSAELVRQAATIAGEQGAVNATACR